MKKEVRELIPRMQKFIGAIKAYNVCISFFKGIHNHISEGHRWEDQRVSKES